jgi:D-aminoacyl-tRNA deacylase
MGFSVVTSKDNLAGVNIVSFLPKGFPLKVLDGHICFLDKADAFEAEPLVFASTHKSAAGKPSLTTHPVGNWGKAELGGKDRHLVPTNSFLLKNFLTGLEKKRDELSLPYDVSLEVTHHGPFLSRQTVFIELGSCEEQWKDLKAAEAIAQVIQESTSTEGDFRSAIALGGGHYAPEFTKLVLRTEWALGHICPQYALPLLDQEMLSKALATTFPKPEAIILDWKGLKSEKSRIQELLEKQDLPVFRVRKLLG